METRKKIELIPHASSGRKYSLTKETIELALNPQDIIHTMAKKWMKQADEKFFDIEGSPLCIFQKIEAKIGNFQIDLEDKGGLGDVAIPKLLSNQA